MKSDKAYEVQHSIESLLAVEKWRVAAIPHLVERLSDEREPDENIFGPNFTIADQAGEALSTIGKPAVPALQKVIVERGNDEARIRAIEALGQIGYDAADAVSALCGCARDENELIRYHAVVSLGKVAPNPKRVLAPLTVALDDQDPDVKSAAVLALGAMGPKAEAAVPRLVGMLDTNDLRSDWPTWLPLRIDVAEAIGRIGKRESMAIAILEPMLQDRDPLVRIGAALAHCQLSTDPTPGLEVLTKELIVPRCKDTDSVVRASAIEVLGQDDVNDARLIDLFIEALSDPDWGVRFYSMEALGRRGRKSEKAIPHLEAMARSDHEWDRNGARKTLRRIQSQKQPAKDVMSDKNVR